MVTVDALPLCQQAQKTYEDFIAIQSQPKSFNYQKSILDHAQVLSLLRESNDIYQQFIKLNTYQFKENTIEYFYIEKGALLLDQNLNVQVFHQQVLENLNMLIGDLSCIKDGEVSKRTVNLMHRIYHMIQNGFNDNMTTSEYAYKVLKKIIVAYIDYIQYFIALIENNKDKKVVEMIHLINAFFKKIGIYTIAAHPGDPWDLTFYEPEVNDSNNETDNETLEDCIHRVYYYAYVIDVFDKDEPIILKEGKAGIWVVKE